MRNVSSMVGTGHLGSRRKDDRGDLQRDLADHLPDPGLDPVEVPQDHLAGSDPVGCPALVFLDSFEHHLEAVRQVGEDVIVVARFAMVGIEDRRGAADQDRAGNQSLQMRGRLQQGDELRVPTRYFCVGWLVLHRVRLSD